MRDYADVSGLIHRIRGRRVMLGGDLAALYEVQPRALVQAVKRNRRRFPEDFCFQLSEPEFEILKSQTVISSWGGSRRAYPRDSRRSRAVGDAASADWIPVGV
ncbi:MAG: ORF6N domain-containing protein [Elusimicrobia bacterium]|nr:ORF6N domain-containing protein [Elusimicrobiota bacterium]